MTWIPVTASSLNNYWVQFLCKSLSIFSICDQQVNSLCGLFRLLFIKNKAEQGFKSETEGGSLDLKYYIYKLHFYCHIVEISFGVCR